MTNFYDLIIVGTGPGGYVCGIRAAQLGMKVAVVEKRATHGGTCLNVGCIPSKALLHTSELFEQVQSGEFAAMGINVAKTQLDLKAMTKHRNDVVMANVQGIEGLLKKNKIDSFCGTARIVSVGKVQVKDEKGKLSSLNGKHIVIATGSEPTVPKGFDIDEKQLVTSTGALSLQEVPSKLLVIGAGVIGLELGSVWRRLGSQVTVVELADHILSGMDQETARAFHNILQKQGISFKLSSKVTAIDKSPTGLKVQLTSATGEAMESLQANVVLLAIGRSPYTRDLGLEEMGLARDERGRIKTDSNFQTNIQGIYAIGDVIAGPMLAHKASEEGIALAEKLAGQAGHVNYGVIPSVIYTMPEVASIGQTEESLQSSATPYNSSKFPFTANGRARAIRHTAGFVKILADKVTDRILGAHIIGANAGEMIHEIAVLMEFGGSAEDLARTCHAHPTLSEAIKEAALGINKATIHM